MAKILVVDDNELNRDMLSRRLLKQGLSVEVAEDGERALAQLARADFDLVLLDIQMPVLDGFGVLEKMKSDGMLRRVPVIVISAQSELENVVRCIEMGAEDYLPKPFNAVLLRARINSSLEKKRLHDLEETHRQTIEDQNRFLEVRVSEQVKEIASAQLAAIFAMSKLAESKDPETGAHLERMREYCKILATEFKRTGNSNGAVDDTFIDNIYAASPLHDIGKVGVPDDILLKPGKLDELEWVTMKTHTTIGAQTLRAVDLQHPGNSFVRMGIDIAEGHHEKWDGSGYPRGLVGDAIPLAARILALGDVYDALTSKRCYKEPFSHEKSRGIIVEGSGGHFDPAVVEAFLSTEDQFVMVRKQYHDDED